MKINYDYNLYEIHSFTAIRKPLIWKDGVAYEQSCMNCKYSSHPKKNYKYDYQEMGCALMCLEVDDTDTCDNFMFEPKKSYYSREE